MKAIFLYKSHVRKKSVFLGYGLKHTESIRLQVFQIELYLIKEMMK